MKYTESNIDERIIRAVTEMGYENMTPIQEQAIPYLLEGRDVLGQAQTGTGKTAAFGIPCLQKIDVNAKGTQCIILCPTRELAIQACTELRKFAKFMHEIRVVPIYGGQDINRQISLLRGNVAIVVGTPGRVMDHMRRHTLKLENVKMLVLDEADEMLNMGFREDIETILKEIPGEHQTALFSATMPKAILDITHEYQKDPVNVKVAAEQITIPLVKQYYYEVKRQNKTEVVARLLDYYNPKRSLIFCNTKKMVDDLLVELKERGYMAEGLHGDMSQANRDKVMNGFRTGFVKILIATDVAARGIDVSDVEAVFNYDIPQDIEYYVHRIGRTGRAGKTGRSFTLVVGREIYRIRDIENTCNTKMTARVIPTSKDITNTKASKALEEVMVTINSSDISSMIPVIEKKMADTGLSAMEIAAGFLRLHVGEDKEDIPVENYRAERRKAKMERKAENAAKRAAYFAKRDSKERKPSKEHKDFKKTEGYKATKITKERPRRERKKQF